ncbi:hypothetical protein MTP99_011240 [Tenebrio molitor]|nr:hypothetical protein MTP99_011240 [Tenebrio molitor]
MSFDNPRPVFFHHRHNSRSFQLSATLRVKGVILTGSTGSINRSTRSGFELHFRSFPSTGADRKVGAIDPTPLRSEGLRDRFIGGRSGEVGVLSVR